jgi:hypothetical protein
VSLEEARAAIKASFEIKEYQPREQGTEDCSR